VACLLGESQQALDVVCARKLHASEDEDRFGGFLDRLLCVKPDEFVV
jgi:hypothetical protein